MINNKLITLSIILLSLTTFVTSRQKIDLFPGEEWSTGHLKASHPSKSLFYYFFKCRNKTLENPPLLIWLQGGPAYSSAMGVFSHGGPYIVNNITGKIGKNPYAWNEIADVLFIDQPAGTLFSFATDYTKICRDMECVAEDLVAFTLNFYEKYPEYYNRDLYISGISYGGHYVPVFAQKVAKKAPQIRLKGLIAFNAYFDFAIQIPLNMKLLYDRGLVDLSTYEMISGFYSLCLVFQALKVPVLSEVCGQADSLIFQNLGTGMDPYNIEAPYGPDIYETTMLPYLNLPDVQAALGVNQRFYLFNWTIYYHFLKDSMDTTLDELTWDVSQGYKTYLVYGEADFMCSAIGGQAVAEAMDWEGRDELIEQPFQDWTMDGVLKARYKEVKNFKFIGVPHAGHSIFSTQRALGLEILRDLMKGS